jgi:hypothetical protein
VKYPKFPVKLRGFADPDKKYRIATQSVIACDTSFILVTWLIIGA